MKKRFFQPIWKFEEIEKVKKAELKPDMKKLLFGIEQRFYTTPVGGEKRIANSVILLNA